MPLSRQTLVLGTLAALLTAWPLSAADDAPVVVVDGSGAAVPPGGPDQVGGHATTHIVVRLGTGITPAADAFVWPTIDAGGPIDAQLQAWAVLSVTPLLDSPPKDASIPAGDRLARTYLLHVAPGTDTPTMAAQFAAAAGVEMAAVDDIGEISSYTPNDPSYAPQQWNMNNTGQSGGTPGADIDAPEAWSVFRGSAAVTLAILDTGVSATHPDLAGRVIAGRNTYDNNDDTDDPHGHGSHVTGIAAANGDDGIGVAGVNWECAILPVRCTNAGGTTNSTAVNAAMVWAVDHDADIMSMSLQFYSDSALLLRDGVTYAAAAGVLPVAAVGNNRGQLVAFPAKYPECVAVGATTRFDVRWSGSNYGPETDVVAPGEAVYSLWTGSGYLLFNGSSMATPHVSGLAALMLGFNPALTAAELHTLLSSTADDLGPFGFDNEYGFGRVNAYRALAAASPYPLGDLNCDSVTDFFDIDAFLLALFDLAAYPVAYVDCDISRGDFDVDGAVNFFDIDPFVAALFAP